jgi:hypothetical protein
LGYFYRIGLFFSKSLDHPDEARLHRFIGAIIPVNAIRLLLSLAHLAEVAGADCREK